MNPNAGMPTRTFLPFLAVAWLAGCGGDVPTAPGGTRLLHVRLEFPSWYSPDERFGLLVDGAALEDPAAPGMPWEWDGMETGSVTVAATARQVALVALNGICRVEGNATRALSGSTRPVLATFQVVCPSPPGLAARLVWAEWEEHSGVWGARLGSASPGGGWRQQNLPEFFLSELADLEGTVYGIGGRREWDDWGVWFTDGLNLVAIEAGGEVRYLSKQRQFGGLRVLDGGSLGLQEEQEMLTIRPGEDTRFLSRLSLPLVSGRVPLAAWAPDGSRVAAYTGSAVVVISLDDGLVTQVLATQVDRSLSWSPDGRFVAFIRPGPTGDELVVVATDGEIAWKASLYGSVLWGEPAWLPDGSGVALAGSVDQRWGLFLVRSDGTTRRLTLRPNEPTAWTLVTER